MDAVKEVRDSWGWTGINPYAVIRENEFGNLIVKDHDGKFWRICPDDVYCKVVAKDESEYQELLDDREFCDDWNMNEIREDARKRLGPLKEGYKYYLVVPGVLGGAYFGENVQSVPFHEVIRYSGSIGEQLRDLKPGDKVDLRVVR